MPSPENPQDHSIQPPISGEAGPQPVQPGNLFADYEISAAPVFAERGGVPQTEQLGVQTFVTERASFLRQGWEKAKSVASKVGDYFSVGDEEYTLSAKENFVYRAVGAAALLKHAANREQAPYHGYHVVFNHYKSQHRERLARRDRDSNTNMADMSRWDLAKMASSEILALAPVRLMGLMALHGAAKAVESAQTERSDGSKPAPRKVASKIKSRTAARLEMHERGFHNPAIAELHGFSRRDIRRLRQARREGMPESVAASSHKVARKSLFSDD
jgi:hypothetical protein